MQIINYFGSDIKNQLIEKIEACDWAMTTECFLKH